MKPVDQARNALAFLEDDTHEHAFDKLIWGLRERRDAAAREVPEWEDLRSLASQIKEHTLSNLERYLELFEERATRNGARVHWARDADEHNQIVGDILNSHGAKHLVKSKSMLTEECKLRPFLEKRGITVTETDLGERIQQLDHQPPAHIVGPALQKTTQDVAELFHRVYGSDPDKADPVYLAHVMREHTRPLILGADAGMTGANFAVAQTGAIVTVTNEGNADLSGNVPALRISSVGIEKIIPGTAELAVFIRLLTRSATGEPITHPAGGPQRRDAPRPDRGQPRPLPGAAPSLTTQGGGVDPSAGSALARHRRAPHCCGLDRKPDRAVPPPHPPTPALPAVPADHPGRTAPRRSLRPALVRPGPPPPGTLD
ncbi:MAG: LUD domain-containing protein [Pseudonocardiaceae bacterium]